MRIYRWVIFLLLGFGLLNWATPDACAEDWKPIDPAQLRLQTPVVEKDADAEAIFWEAHVQDEFDGYTFNTVLRHYIRIKIFTERGRDSQSTVDLPFLGRNQISDISGRTIKPDESVVSLKKEAIFERMLLRAGGLKVKAKSFAMPAVEPGAIIEYRWQENRHGESAHYMRLQFQREMPIQLVKYYIKPMDLSRVSFGMRSMTFHGQTTPFVKEPNGFYSTTMSHVPAFREEPRMPPEEMVKPWMLIYYSENKQLSPQEFWKEHGKKEYSNYKPGMKVNDEVRKTAAAATGDGATPEQKLERLFNFCRTQIKNISDDASGLTPDDLKKLKENKSPADTLKHKMGSGSDLRLLFAALATAAGLEARIALSSDRNDFFFDPNFADGYFLRLPNVAVRVNNEWRFFDPAQTYLPYGMLRWQEEGLDALISDPKEPVFVRTPLSPPEKSQEKRTATLILSEDGTLEGDVQIEYTGHLGAYRKEYNDDDSPSQREETLQEQVRSRLSTAELSNIQILNVTDPVKPFTYAFHVRVPGYGQRTGQRIFLQPGFFQAGIEPLFATNSRNYPVYFHYPWSEEDTVTIQLPEGYRLESPDAPAPLASGSLYRHEIKMTISREGRLQFSRHFLFGGGDNILFPTNVYPQLKQLFDLVHKSDNHTLMVKQNAMLSGAN